jgi:ketosteroid isomerase-like protein
VRAVALKLDLSKKSTFESFAQEVKSSLKSVWNRSDAMRCKGNGEISMSTQENVQIVKNFLAALGRRDKQGLLALSAEDIEWIIPGENWPLAGTHRGHAGLADVLQKANETVETSYPEPPEFIAQGDRVVVVGFATGRIKATNKTFEDHWVFAITVRNGKLTNIREYIDTQALARASEMPASPRL